MDNPSNSILGVRNLSAGYGGRPIVTDIYLQMRLGDVLGLLGANGAGKSTLLKAVTGQIRLLGGTVTINGVDLARRAGAGEVTVRLGNRCRGFAVGTFGPTIPRIGGVHTRLLFNGVSRR